MATRSFACSLTDHSGSAHRTQASPLQASPFHRFRYLGPAALLVLLAIAYPPSAHAHSGGARNGHSGGDFSGERLCTRCHVGSVANSGSGSIALLINGANAADYTYTPGESVSIVVQISDSSAARIGFQLTARASDGCTNAGSIAPDASSKLSEAPGLGDCASTPGTVQWVTHRRAVTGSSAEFTIDWTAPDADASPVKIAAAAVAANGNGSPSGDQVYSVVAEVAAVADEPQGDPMISSEQGVVLGDFYSKTERGAPRALATVIGSDFVTRGSEAWHSFAATKDFPTTLAGTCVNVNGVQAPLKHVSNSRIDFQVPTTVAAGSATVEVLRDCGLATEVSSNEVSFEIASVQPALLRASDDPAAVSALHADGTPVGPKNMLPGIEASPAAPGETISMFGTGFGVVSPELTTGEVAREDRSLASTNFSVSIGDTTVPVADVLYIGAAPGFLGVNRLDVRLPTDLASGIHSVSVEIDDVMSPAGPQLVVGEPAALAQAPQCSSDSNLPAGQSCALSFDGVEVRFTVDADGQKACASVPARNVERCGDQSVELSRYGVSASKDETGMWSVATTGQATIPPEPTTGSTP